MNPMTKFYSVLAILSAAPFSLIAGATTGNRADLVLKKLTCLPTAKVIVMGEIHTDPLAYLVRDHARAFAANRDLLTFLEGDSYIPSSTSNVFGLEDPQIAALSALTVALPIFEVFAYGNIAENNTIAPEKADFVRMMSKRHFLKSFFELRNVWGNLDWLPGTFLKLSDRGVFSWVLDLNAKGEAIPYNLENQIGNSPEWAALEDYKGLADASRYLLLKGIELMKQKSDYRFIDFDQPDSLLGEVRNILFSKAILENYCRAAREDRNIWIQVGAGHLDNLSNMISAYLPTGTRVVKMKPSDLSVRYENWKAEFKDKVWNSFESELKDKEPSIKAEYYPEPLNTKEPSRITILLAPAPKTITYENFRRRVELAGFKILGNESPISRNWSIRVSFDPSK